MNKKDISIIVATSRNDIIGKNNSLPWYSKADLKYFKNITKDNAVIMGRNTYESIGKELPKRLNVVVTSKNIENVNTAKSIEEALDFCFRNNFFKVFFIGGKSIYEEAVKLADTMYITTFINLDVEYEENDKITKMFEYDSNEWFEESYDIITEEKNRIKFAKYKRLNNES